MPSIVCQADGTRRQIVEGVSHLAYGLLRDLLREPPLFVVRVVGRNLPLLELKQKEHVIETDNVIREFHLASTHGLKLRARERELAEEEARIGLGEGLLERRVDHVRPVSTHFTLRRKPSNVPTTSSSEHSHFAGSTKGCS